MTERQWDSLSRKTERLGRALCKWSFILGNVSLAAFLVAMFARIQQQKLEAADFADDDSFAEP